MVKLDINKLDKIDKIEFIEVNIFDYALYIESRLRLNRKDTLESIKKNLIAFYSKDKMRSILDFINDSELNIESKIVKQYDNIEKSKSIANTAIERNDFLLSYYGIREETKIDVDENDVFDIKKEKVHYLTLVNEINKRSLCDIEEIAIIIKQVF